MSLLDQLKRPFPENKIHWRTGNTNWRKIKGAKSSRDGTQGLALPYIDARDAMKRLDDVAGSENWQCRYPLSDDGLLICEIGIRAHVLAGWFPDDKCPMNEWIWKANGAGDTQVEAEKGKCSDSFKRAAVLFGIAQYLYYLPSAWVPLDNGNVVIPPPMPVWATPEGYDELLMKKAEEAKDNEEPVIPDLPDPITERPPQALATKDQVDELSNLAESGVLAERYRSWIPKNIDTLTASDAESMIKDAKRQAATADTK